jgi:hypothetical protein
MPFVDKTRISVFQSFKRGTLNYLYQSNTEMLNGDFNAFFHQYFPFISTLLGYRLDGLGFECWQEQKIFLSSRHPLALGTTQPPQWGLVFIPKVKRR